MTAFSYFVSIGYRLGGSCGKQNYRWDYLCPRNFEMSSSSVSTASIIKTPRLEQDLSSNASRFANLILFIIFNLSQHNLATNVHHENIEGKLSFKHQTDNMPSSPNLIFLIDICLHHLYFSNH